MFLNVPSFANENISSNQHARSATTSAPVDHHSILPAVGPTPAAPSPSSIHSPTRGSSTGATHPSAQYCTRLPSVVSETSTPGSPLVSLKEILKVTYPSTSDSTISRDADQSPILPTTSVATPLMVTTGCINASVAVKSTLIDCPSFATPSGLEFFSCACNIITLVKVGAMPSGPAGSGKSLSVTVFPPPPQAARNSEKDNARTEPK